MLGNTLGAGCDSLALNGNSQLKMLSTILCFQDAHAIGDLGNSFA